MDKLNINWVEKKFNILDFAFQSLWRRKSKNGLIFLIFLLIITIISSILFITGSLTQELLSTSESLPDITIQKIQGGRQVVIEEKYLGMIENIPGVEAVEPRLWGYFYLEELKANFTIYGMNLTDLTEDEYTKISDTPAETPQSDYDMIVGTGVYELLKEVFMERNFIFYQANWEKEISCQIIGTFKAETQLQTNDLMIMQSQGARSVLEIPTGSYSDLAVYIPNPEEIQNIAIKINRAFPELRTITKKNIESTYTSVFNWRSGFVLSGLLISILAFLVLIWDKASGLGAEEKKEIGILKAIGWDTEMVLSVKLYEGFIVSSFACFGGIIASYIFVYVLKAPGLKHIFIGWSSVYPSFDLLPFINLNYLLLIFIFSVIPYCTAILLPAWKVAITDPDVAMRNIN
jgi:ABC-type lipoprotein release transport system permease subunit